MPHRFVLIGCLFLFSLNVYAQQFSQSTSLGNTSESTPIPGSVNRPGVPSDPGVPYHPGGSGAVPKKHNNIPSPSYRNDIESAIQIHRSVPIDEQRTQLDRKQVQQLETWWLASTPAQRREVLSSRPHRRTTAVPGCQMTATRSAVGTAPSR